MATLDRIAPPSTRRVTDSLGAVNVPAQVLWGAQTQRSLEHFSIGQDLILREMITAYATLKKAAANVNHGAGRLSREQHRLIVQTSDEILNGLHADMFPLHVWMTGSGDKRLFCSHRADADDTARTPVWNQLEAVPEAGVRAGSHAHPGFPTQRQ